MPYIRDRETLDVVIDEMHISDVGELNYVITRLTLRLLLQNGINYVNINNTFGTLMFALLEMYRRVAAEYEDVKIRQNGDVPEFMEITQAIRAIQNKLPADLAADTIQAHG